MRRTKCLVIGAGPAGITAGIYLKRGGLDPIIIDKQAPGGQLLKTGDIENYPGFGVISGPELAINMLKGLDDLGVKPLYDEVISVTKNNEFIVKTKNDEIHAKHIIVCTGKEVGKLGLEDEDKLVGKGISYCATCDGFFYRDKITGVVGGGNSAVSEAIYLSNLCEKVYLFVRSDIKADNILVSRMKERENIIVLKGVTIKKINHDDTVNGVLLSNDEEVLLDGLFLAIGGKPNLSFLSDLNLDLNKGYIKVDKNMESNIPGLYAAGDVILKDFYQIITAANDGVVAALDIIEKEGD